MDSNDFDATPQRRYYSPAHAINEHVQGENSHLSSISQPQYAPRELLGSIQGNWAPPAWPSNALPTPSTLNAPQDGQSPFPNEHQNAFDMAFQLPTPWASLPNPVPNGTPANTTLPFPASDSTYLTRSSSAMMATIPASVPLHPSNGYETNDDHDEDNPYITTSMEPNVTSPETGPLYNVAWASSSRRDLESNSQTPPETRAANATSTGNRTSRNQINRDGAPSNRSDSESDGDHRARGRLNHDLTEKRYRKRFNHQFESLLKALPACLDAESEDSIGGPDDRPQHFCSSSHLRAEA